MRGAGRGGVWRGQRRARAHTHTHTTPQQQQHPASHGSLTRAPLFSLRLASRLAQVLEHYGEVTPAWKQYLFWDVLNVERDMGTLTQVL